MVLLGTIDAIAITTVSFLWVYGKLAIANIKNDGEQPLQPLYGALMYAVMLTVMVEFLPGIVHFIDATWNTVMGVL